jgi:hypothetical protein
MVALSPRLGEFLTKATQTPDLETALWKVLLEYVELKSKALKEQIVQFESKWGMSFEEFSQRCREGTLQADPYSWEVEQDFWAWEKAVTLLRHYETLWEYGHQGLR